MDYNLSQQSSFINGMLDVFTSSYKNVRFNVQMKKYIIINSAFEANLPGLSFIEYGTTDLWRLIMIANGLSDPLNDIIVGKKIGIPDLEDVTSYLLRKTSNQIADVTI